MTNEQKDRIKSLRQSGESYKAIAEKIAVSKDMVKLFCRRNHIIVESKVYENSNRCRNCDSPIMQNPKVRKKVFCSVNCRTAWWKAHPHLSGKNTAYTSTPASTAESLSQFMVIQQENIAPMHAISPSVLREILMMSEKINLNTAEEFVREKRYLAARSVAESMLKAGLISPKELSEIDTKLLEKYRPSLSTLSCGKPLHDSQ